MRRCVFIKTLNAYFRLGDNSLPVVVAQPHKTLANRAPKKGALR